MRAKEHRDISKPNIDRYRDIGNIGIVFPVFTSYLGHRLVSFAKASTPEQRSNQAARRP